MKLLKVTMKQCSLLRQLKPDEYLGTRIGTCPAKIEHIVVSNRRVHVLKKSCDDCVLAKLMRATHVIGQPVIRGDETIVFIVRDNKYTRRLLREHNDDIVDVGEVDYREVYLTLRQKEALRMLANGEASNISRLARKLGISKPAALKLVKSSIKKLASKYS
ncbi:MAG: hypothetical protein GSR73_04450 [Desulfurococcales archaeon]|nr:hypothetical protein [Desulfurococcales archaeon]